MGSVPEPVRQPFERMASVGRKLWDTCCGTQAGKLWVCGHSAGERGESGGMAVVVKREGSVEVWRWSSEVEQRGGAWNSRGSDG
jgi:hypothetical protein